MTRLTLLLLALAVVTLAGCNADWLTGTPKPVCPWVPVDTVYALTAAGDTVGTAITSARTCQ